MLFVEIDLLQSWLKSILNFKVSYPLIYRKYFLLYFSRFTQLNLLVYSLKEQL
jgi:hypothetical protein